MKRDRDYVVKDGKIIIVDEFTGRLMYGRRYSDGLHQAIEAKEGVKVEERSQTLASITIQNYFRMYEKLAGMTGTAATEEEEFRKIYNLDVVVIPTNEPMIRVDYPDVIYKTERAKFQAVVEEIVDCHRRGQPVLVGTVSIEKSEYLSRLLKERGVPHNVLNAKYHEREAEIVAQAGRLGAVTIATNMAGRGTDILLGGNPEFLAKKMVAGREEEIDPAEYEEILARKREETAAEREKVIALGGLHIIGTERHEARRIDNQLRGRAGRQGDPGSSRFYLSLEDDLMRLFGSDNISGIMDRLGLEEDQPIEHPLITRAIENAQRRVEARNFEIRRRLLRYDDILNEQRAVIYEQRQQILRDEDLKGYILRMTEDVLTASSRLLQRGTDPEHWDPPACWRRWKRPSCRRTLYLLRNWRAWKGGDPGAPPGKARAVYEARRRSWVPRTCGSWSGSSCSGWWTASGWNTWTPSMSCGRGLASGPTVSGTPSSSTPGNPTRCSRASLPASRKTLSAMPLRCG